MKRLLLGLLIVPALGIIGVCLLAPTDDLLRSALSGLAGPNRPQVRFASSHLRPWGLAVQDVTVQDPNGQSFLTIQRLTVRPTLSALLHLSWQPLQVGMELCGGTLSGQGTIDQQRGAAVDLRWNDLQVDRCGLPDALQTVGGRTSGTASVRQAQGALRPQGDGHLEVDAARVPVPDSPIQDIDEVQVDHLDTDWHLDAQKLTLQNTSFKTPDLQGRGQGTVQLRPSLHQSGLQLRFTVTPQPYARPPLQRILRALPPAPGEPAARLLIVDGTIGEPQVVRNE